MSIHERAHLGAQRVDRRAASEGLASCEGRRPSRVRRPRGLRTLRIAMLGVAIASVIGGVGCSGGSGSGSDGGVARPSSAPIDLAPGQTSATLSWEASAGSVEGYEVYVSRNGSGFGQSQFVQAPRYQLQGAPGDSVRLVVMARGTNGTRSQPSPASPAIRFHAADAPTAQTASVSAGATLSSGGSAHETLAEAGRDAAASEDGTPNEAGDDTSDASDVAEEDASEALQPIDAALRDQLLIADARLPIGGPGPEALAWLQSAVDAHVGAGVSLAGTGERGGDGLRELVWVDAIGQLFVSEGADLAATGDVSSTFVEAIRLEPTERFVALADLDGDGAGDWVLEDTATGSVWAGGFDAGDLAAVPAPTAGATLLGVGDFDGDGRAELVWRDAGSALRFADRDGGWIDDASDPNAFADLDADDLLAIADVNGDGRDDLVFGAANDRLALGVSRSLADSAVAFDRTAGPDASTRDRELVGTLDADGDGAADVAWWSDGAVYLWDLHDGS